MTIERDTDDEVKPAPTPWRWESYCPGIEVYTRAPVPTPGKPFTGGYIASADTSGRWRVYPDERSVDPVERGVVDGEGLSEERRAQARGEVERVVGERRVPA